MLIAGSPVGEAYGDSLSGLAHTLFFLYGTKLYAL